MMKKRIAMILCAVILLAVCALWGTNLLLTNLLESTNVCCRGQRFSTVDEAMEAMEAEARKDQNSSLDYCPPYEAVYTFEYEDNTIVFFSYHHSFDQVKSSDYAVRILRHHADGTLSFDSGFADFKLREPELPENYYYFTNVQTSKGKRSISFLYLNKDSNQDIYVDGKKTEKILVSMEGHEFYLCYGISKRDTLLSNILTLISNRHEIKIQ